MTKEKKEEYYMRLGIVVVILLLGVLIMVQHVILSATPNGYASIVGLELIGAAILLLKNKFKGFRGPTE